MSLEEFDLRSLIVIMIVHYPFSLLPPCFWRLSRSVPLLSRTNHPSRLISYFVGHLPSPLPANRSPPLLFSLLILLATEGSFFGSITEYKILCIAPGTLGMPPWGSHRAGSHFSPLGDRKGTPAKI